MIHSSKESEKKLVPFHRQLKNTAEFKEDKNIWQARRWKRKGLDGRSKKQ